MNTLEDLVDQLKPSERGDIAEFLELVNRLPLTNEQKKEFIHSCAEEKRMIEYQTVHNRMNFDRVLNQINQLC